MTDVYVERASRLPGAVVWSRALSGYATAASPVLPDGCMDLLWTEGRLLVAGPDTRAYVPDGVPGGWAGSASSPVRRRRSWAFRPTNSAICAWTWRNCGFRRRCAA